MTSRARALRKEMSTPEVLLWGLLRGRSPHRPKFRRQHPIGSVIADFFCPAARLAVEIDGATHWDEEKRQRDEARDAWLWRQGVTVLRIPASAVYRDVAAVADRIFLRADELIAADTQCSRPSPSTTRSSAGGPPPPLTRER
jgi:very-short-patch-repair endonuclease